MNKDGADRTITAEKGACKLPPLQDHVRLDPDLQVLALLFHCQCHKGGVKCTVLEQPLRSAFMQSRHALARPHAIRHEQ